MNFQSYVTSCAVSDDSEGVLTVDVNSVIENCQNKTANHNPLTVINTVPVMTITSDMEFFVDSCNICMQVSL